MRLAAAQLVRVRPDDVTLALLDRLVEGDGAANEVLRGADKVAELVKVSEADRLLVPTLVELTELEQRQLLRRDFVEQGAYLGPGYCRD